MPWAPSTRALRIVAWIEVVVGVLLLVGAVHPFTDFCSGRALGLDCETRVIIAVNALGPFGVLLTVCGGWLSRTRSMTSQYALVLGTVAILAYWFSFSL